MSINEISDHLSNNFVPGAVEPFVCVDMQMGIDLSLVYKRQN